MKVLGSSYCPNQLAIFSHLLTTTQSSNLMRPQTCPNEVPKWLVPSTSVVACSNPVDCNSREELLLLPQSSVCTRRSCREGVAGCCSSFVTVVVRGPPVMGKRTKGMDALFLRLKIRFYQYSKFCAFRSSSCIISCVCDSVYAAV